MVPLFSTRRIEVLLNNDGPDVLMVDPATLDPPYAIRPVDGAGQAAPWTIEPGSSRSFIASYSPPAPGSHEAVLPLIGDKKGRTIQHQGQAADGWQNPINPLDVDGNGFVTAQDVLFLINAINSDGAGALPPRTAENPGASFFLDPTGEGTLTPSDVLLVINEINRSDSGEPEGEADLATRDVHAIWEPPNATGFQQTFEGPSDPLTRSPQPSRRAATTTDLLPFPVAESNRSVQDRATDEALLAMVADDPLLTPVDLILADDDPGNRSPLGRPVDGRRP
jgi:hypothetical protein